MIAGIAMNTNEENTIATMPCTASDDSPVSMPRAMKPPISTTMASVTSIAPDAIRAATLAIGTSTATPSPVTRSSVA